VVVTPPDITGPMTLTFQARGREPIYGDSIVWRPILIGKLADGD